MNRQDHEQSQHHQQELEQQEYEMKVSSEMLSACKHISYDPISGQIQRLTRRNSNGSFDKEGYLIIKIKGKQWKAHRLAWCKHYGKPPLRVIDHINGDRKDNRIINLRDVSQKQNVINTKRSPNPDTGFVGIYLDKSTKGLVAKYTTRHEEKTHRFRNVSEAVRFRKDRGLEI